MRSAEPSGVVRFKVARSWCMSHPSQTTTPSVALCVLTRCMGTRQREMFHHSIMTTASASPAEVYRFARNAFALSESPVFARPYEIPGSEGDMIPIDLSGKTALITGVGDNESFAWFIAKALQAAGARLVLAVHPRMIRIVEGFLSGDSPDDVESRKLPYGGGSLTVEKLLPCDVSFDTMADVPEVTRNDRRYKRVEEQYGDYSIEGLMKTVKESYGSIDFLIHSVAFAPEIKSKLIDTTRAGYWTAISISAYSLVGLVRAGLPLMEGRPGGASVVGLTYLGGS